MSAPPGNGQPAQQQAAATQNAVMALFSRLREVAAGMLAEVRAVVERRLQVAQRAVALGVPSQLCSPAHPLPNRPPFSRRALEAFTSATL